MTHNIKKIAINTGGGDAPGLNAVIRAAVLSALNRGWACYGIQSHRAHSGDGSGVGASCRLSGRCVVPEDAEVVFEEDNGGEGGSLPNPPGEAWKQIKGCKNH